MKPLDDRTLLSVVVPVYNEQAGVAEFHRRLASVLADVASNWEVVYVNDGSTDRSLDALDALRISDERVCLLDLSRNFGKELAMTAGLDHALGDAVVIIDADLQDPPELIPALVDAWLQGCDVAYAKRTKRLGETWLKKFTAATFYRLVRRVSRVEIPPDTGDFRLLSRRAVDALRQCREQHRFMKGLFAWIGFRQVAVPYVRDSRFAGSSSFNYWRLWNFAIEGLTSFTIAPLKVATYVGTLVAGLAFTYACWIIFKTLAFGEPVPGYPSLMVVVLFLGGLQLLCVGILGEYIGRMFNESKNRPLYLINRHEPARCQTGVYRDARRKLHMPPVVD